MESTANSHDHGRRSTRIRTQIPFRLTRLDTDVRTSERCYTLVVNPQGCGVRLSKPLEPGVPVELDELPGGTSVTARVANCVPLGTEGKFWLVGIALDQPGNVWCIRPEPADWGSETKVPVPTVVVAAPAKKKNEWPYSQFSNKGEFHPGRK
jgi:hypothetical protein